MKSRKLDDTGVKNLQENMAKKYYKIQNDLEETSKIIGDMTFIGNSYGDTITSKFTGEKVMSGIEIEKELLLKKMVEEGLLKKDDVDDDKVKKVLDIFLEVLPDYLMLSINDAIKKVDDYTDKEISKITKDLPPIPGLK